MIHYKYRLEFYFGDRMLIEKGGYGCPICGDYKKDFNHDRKICSDCARTDRKPNNYGAIESGALHKLRQEQSPDFAERLDVGFMLLNDEFDEHEPRVQSSFDIWGR